MVSVVIITKNEEHNIARALQSVASWASEILVIDSGSTDKTVEIAENHGATVIFNAWPGFGAQKNFGHLRASQEWVLSLDADEVIPPALAAEIQSALPGSRAAAYSFPRRTFFLGRWIMHGGWYPNRVTRLARKPQARWTEPPVHEELIVEGKTEELKSDLEHYSFRGIADQVATNVHYSQLGFERLKQRGKKPNLRLLVFKPLGKFIETYFLKQGFLDGVAGFIISWNAAHSIFMKYAYFYEENPKP